MKNTSLLIGMCLILLCIKSYASNDVKNINLLYPFSKSSGTHIISKYKTSTGGIITLFGSQLGKGLYIDSTLDSEVIDIVANLVKFEKLKLIYLNSLGGKLDTGIQLGKLFRSNNLVTIINSEDYCHSACFIAFLGGAERLLTVNVVAEGSTGYYRKKDGLLSSHTPYYFDKEQKRYLTQNSKTGQVLCTYLINMLGEEYGNRVCFEMFSSKGEATYSAFKMKELKIITNFTENYSFEYIKSFEIPKESQWYANCFLKASDFEIDSTFGRCDNDMNECIDISKYAWPEYKTCIEERGIPFTPGTFLASPPDNLTILLKRQLEINGSLKMVAKPLFW